MSAKFETSTYTITGTNSSTGKPASGATVSLFQTSQQGPQFINSVKADAQGKFVFTEDVAPGKGGGPLLQQLHHQAAVPAAPQRQVHQVAAAQLQALGIGIGEHLPVPSRLQPHLHPGGRRSCRWAGAQPCEAHGRFLG